MVDGNYPIRIIHFINHAPVADPEFKKSLPRLAERERSDAIEVISKPFQLFCDSLPYLRIKRIQICLCFRGNDKPPLAHVELPSLSTSLQHFVEILIFSGMLGLNRFLEPPDKTSAKRQILIGIAHQFTQNTYDVFTRNATDVFFGSECLNHTINIPQKIVLSIACGDAYRQRYMSLRSRK